MDIVVETVGHADIQHQRGSIEHAGMDLELSGKRASSRKRHRGTRRDLRSNDLVGVTRDADKRAGRSAGKSENQPRGGALGWRFAIAMTILVLNISVPTAETVSADRLPDALGRVAPQVISVSSASSISRAGVGQHNQYHFIDRRIAGFCGSTFFICC